MSNSTKGQRRIAGFGIRNVFVEPIRVIRALRYYRQSQLISFPSEFEKRQIINGFLMTTGVRTFVETGTYLGNTTAAVLPNVDRAISIEIDPDLGRQARERFDGDPRVEILTGASEELLPRILSELREPALFWLDGHHSGGVTGGDPKSAPIIQELTSILRHPIKNHIVLIDDARLFVGRNGYPSISGLARFVRENGSDHRVNIYADIIRIYRSEYSVNT